MGNGCVCWMGHLGLHFFPRCPGALGGSNFKGISKVFQGLGQFWAKWAFWALLVVPFFPKMSGVAGSVKCQRYFKGIGKVPAVLGEMGVWGVSVPPFPPPPRINRGLLGRALQRGPGYDLVRDKASPSRLLGFLGPVASIRLTLTPRRIPKAFPEGGMTAK